MEILAMTLADIPAAAQIMASNPLWRRYNVTEASVAQRFERGLSECATIVVALFEGEVVGFVWFIARGAFGWHGYIPLVGVHPQKQNQGVGAALMDYAEKELATSSAHIFLLVSHFNEGAQRFYQLRGYRQVGSLLDFVVPGITELILHKYSQAPG